LSGWSVASFGVAVLLPLYLNGFESSKSIVVAHLRHDSVAWAWILHSTGEGDLSLAKSKDEKLKQHTQPEIFPN
jgi:hypothetical protein